MTWTEPSAAKWTQQWAEHRLSPLLYQDALCILSGLNAVVDAEGSEKTSGPQRDYGCASGAAFEFSGHVVVVRTLDHLEPIHLRFQVFVV